MTLFETRQMARASRPATRRAICEIVTSLGRAAGRSYGDAEVTSRETTHVMPANVEMPTVIALLARENKATTDFLEGSVAFLCRGERSATNFARRVAVLEFSREKAGFGGFSGLPLFCRQ